MHQSVQDPIVLTSSTSPIRYNWLFLSSCPEPWGGSEELWAGAARILAKSGHRVSACKTLVVSEHPRIKELADAGITVEDYLQYRLPGLQQAAYQILPRRFRLRWVGEYECFYMLHRRLRLAPPDMAVVSQGENFDGFYFANACAQHSVPYVLVCQKASDLNWPTNDLLEPIKRAFIQAQRVYFVSEHNRALTERQIACRLPNAEVVRNPFQTKVADPLPYPEAVSGRFRLACAARLFVLEKGQDMLLEVLAQKKWQARNIEVNFYGQGVHRKALEGLIAMIGLRNVSLCGFTQDITEVWRTHHALVLPSRAEGLPLALVEAMLCGRPGIVTNAGGNAEVIDDGRTGFLAGGIAVASLDEALERAWQRRGEWEQIGIEAARQIRKLVPADPCGDFAAKLTEAAARRREETVLVGS